MIGHNIFPPFCKFNAASGKFYVILASLFAVFKIDIERSQQSRWIFKAPVDVSVLLEGKLPIIWVLGGPGSGKGTQCDRIIKEYGFTHLSTGDLLRAEVASGSERGKNLSAIMERGELVPNVIVLDLLKEAMVSRAANAKGFLIDGYPREKDQGVAFENEIAPCTTILYFEASCDTLTSRLLGRAVSSGRADDNEETIKLRLNTFLENNDKVLALYPNKLQRINAEVDPDKVYSEVKKILAVIMEERERQIN